MQQLEVSGAVRPL